MKNRFLNGIILGALIVYIYLILEYYLFSKIGIFDSLSFGIIRLLLFPVSAGFLAGYIPQRGIMRGIFSELFFAGVLNGFLMEGIIQGILNGLIVSGLGTLPFIISSVIVDFYLGYLKSLPSFFELFGGFLEQTFLIAVFTVLGGLIGELMGQIMEKRKADTKS